MIRGLLRDSAIYGVAAIVSKGLTLVLLFVYGRVLSPEGFGAFELVTTFGVLVALTVPLEVSQGLGRHYAEADGQARVRLLSTAWWFSVAMYLVFFVVTYPMAPVIAEKAFGDADLLNACRLGIAFISFNGLYTFLLNQFRWELQARRYAIVSVGYSATTLAITALTTLGLGLGLNGALVSQVIAAATASTASLFLLWRKIRFSFDIPTLQTMLRFSGASSSSGSCHLFEHVSEQIQSQRVRDTRGCWKFCCGRSTRRHGNPAYSRRAGCTDTPGVRASQES